MRGNELLEQMALVDPAYVAEADVAPKKKNRNIWRTVAAILCVVLCGGLTYYIVPFLSLGNPPAGSYVTKTINTPWEYEGNSITVTGVTVTDSYLAQNGVLYSENKDDYLVIVRCKAIMAPGWSIAGHNLTSATSAGTILCSPSAPLIEISESGEAFLILLFSIPRTEYAGSIEAYHLEIQIRSAEHWGIQDFSFFE